MLEPARSGICGVLQLLVPLATPEDPFELDHVTEATPMLSRAVPLIAMLDADVYETELAGDTMDTEGGVVSERPEPPANVYVTCIPALAWVPFCACAVTRMTLTPGFSGMAPVFQFVVPVAVPPPPCEFIQVTRTMPVPPDAVPASVTVELLVL